MSILLRPEGAPGALGEELEDKPTLVPYIVESEKRACAVVVCPGGGYTRRAAHEGGLSNEKRVSPDTPPTFLWHTADDASVPVENSLLFASALSRNHVPFDLHVYESGRHGLGLAEDHLQAHSWTQVCGAWLRKRGF